MVHRRSPEGKRKQNERLRISSSTFFDREKHETVSKETGSAHLLGLRFYVEQGEVLGNSYGEGILNI